MLSEEVEALVDVFGAWTKLGIGGNFQSSTVVLEDTAMHSCFGGWDWKATILHLLQQSNDWDCFLNCFGQSNIFCLSGGQMSQRGVRLSLCLSLAVRVCSCARVLV